MINLFELIEYLHYSIAAIGIIIIFLSALKSLYKFLVGFFSNSLSINSIRSYFGYTILLGLEFIIAADVISSIIKPTYYELGALFILVIIRTILGYFLNKELEELSHKAP